MIIVVCFFNTCKTPGMDLHLEKLLTGSDLQLHALHWPQQAGDFKSVVSRQEKGGQESCKTTAVKYKGSFPHLVGNYWNNNLEQHLFICNLDTLIYRFLLCYIESNLKTSLQLTQGWFK